MLQQLPPLVEHKDLGTDAPVVEALLQMRFPKLGSPVEDFRGLGEQLGFPNFQEHVELYVEVPEGEGEPSIKRDLLGFIFVAEDGGKAVHIRRDRFTVLVHKPYPGWQQLLDFARATWARFLTIATPPEVAQMSLRYINHLRSDARLLPFRAPSPDLFGVQRDHFQRLSFQHPREPSYGATVMYGTLPTDESSVMFDISVRAITDVAPSDYEFWDHFRNLRTFKNDLFFGYFPADTW